jgi:site-specific DNA-adenine methylase
MAWSLGTGKNVLCCSHTKHTFELYTFWHIIIKRAERLILAVRELEEKDFLQAQSKAEQSCQVRQPITQSHYYASQLHCLQNHLYVGLLGVQKVKQI